MSLNHSHLAFAAVALVLLGLSGCASAEPAALPEPADSSATPTAAPAPTATQEPAPLLVVSGTYEDQDGQSLSVTLTTTSVREPTDQDRADYAATQCSIDNPTYQPLASPEARIVTMSVDVVGSPGFHDWTDQRGVRVEGAVFDGPIWGAEGDAAGSDCSEDSVIKRPGSGEVRIFGSADGWNVVNPVAGNAAITLAIYGMTGATIDNLGQPTGIGPVIDCVTTPSAEFDTLALDLWEGRWGRSQSLPEYCLYGRSAGD